MEYKEIAKNVKVPVLGIGTWGIGGKHSADYSMDDYGVNSIKTAIDFGISHIDTAEYYGAGHTEELVGKAIKTYRRENLFITTKVYRTHLHYSNVLSSLKKSLQRLSTNYVDLFLIHWPSPDVPLKETINALEDCVDRGYAKFIGVSNFSIPLFKGAQSHLKKHLLVANQLYYNLTRVNKKYFKVVSPTEFNSFCQDKNILLVAWSPLEEGRLAKTGFQTLDEMAKKYQKTQAQISLNWLISQKKVIAVTKSTSTQHMKENLGSIGWVMDESDRKQLEASFCQVGRPS